MSETSTETTSTETTGTTDTAGGWKPPASQADLDRIISDRLVRERAKFADYDDLRSAKAELDTIRESQQNDTEKAVTAARKDADKAARTEVTARFVDRIARSEIRAATAGRFADPDDAVAYFVANGRLGEFVDANGELQGDALTRAVDDLLKNKPHLAAKDPQTFDLGQGARGASTSAGEIDWLTPAKN